jgi:hypothetical protein
MIMQAISGRLFYYQIYSLLPLEKTITQANLGPIFPDPETRRGKERADHD